MIAVRGVILVLALVLVAAGLAAALPTQALVVEDATTGEQLLLVPVSEGSTVALEYTHSVERSLVVDEYTVDRDGRLEMTRMEFGSYGAGLPASADVSVVDGRFVFDPPGVYGEVYVAPGRIADHRLRVDGRVYDLVALSDARSVRIAVERRSALSVALSRLP